MITIYALLFVGSRVAYVGATARLRQRLAAHAAALAAGRHQNSRLQAAYLHGVTRIKYAVLTTCPVEDAVATEAQWIDRLGRKYSLANIRPATAATNLGRKHTTATREKMAAARRGKPGRQLTREQSLAMNMLRGPASAAQCARMKALGTASGKAVVNVQTGESYPSARAAARAIGVSPSSIVDCCSGRLARVKGAVWRRVKH